MSESWPPSAAYANFKHTPTKAASMIGAFDQRLNVPPDRSFGPMSVTSSPIPIDEDEADAPNWMDDGLPTVAKAWLNICRENDEVVQTAIAALGLIKIRTEQGRIVEIAPLIEQAAAVLSRTRVLASGFLASLRPRLSAIVDLNACILSLRERLTLAVDASIELEMTLSDSDAFTLCDPAAFEGALISLVANAGSAMPYGGRLRVETCPATIVAADSNYRTQCFVAVCVSDTGGGADRDGTWCDFLLPHQSAFGRRDWYPDFNTVKDFIRASRGYAEINSTPDRGTSVRMYLPRADAGSACWAGETRCL